MKKIDKKYLRYFLMFCGVLLVISAGLVAGTVLSLVSDNSLDADNLKMNFTTFIYYTDAEEGEEREMQTLYDGENRVWIDINDMPKYLKDAFVSIEDERFYKHSGFDVKRLTKATFNFVTTGNPSFGGSTITQQLVKNLTGDDETTIRRKVKEVFRAYKLEQDLSKEQILELYLNTIYLSQQCNGVQTAANVYFGKDVSELSLAESASIAGITQYPSRYDPLVNPDKNKEKQKLVLDKMLELGYIDKAEHDKAVEEKLVFASKGKEEVTKSQSYFVDALIDEVLEDLQKEKGYAKQIALKMLYSGGLKVYATVDMNVQKSMEKVFEDNKNFPKYSGDTQPEAAMVVLDPATGGILGIVGGRGEKTASRTLNRATHTLRQPGSTIKPIGVYAPAIEYGQISPSSTVVDAPITINGWTPQNSGGGFSGTVSIKTAVARSLNIPAVKVLDKLGVNTSYNFLVKNLGITSLINSEKRNNNVFSDKNLSSLALGGLTDGVSVIEMAGSYAPFANKGIYSKPHTYTKILDHKGNVILENEDEKVVAMSERTAYLMNQLLKGVINHGTGTAASLSTSIPAAGKTGTTSDDKDRWFIGYTPYYVGAVWFGYDQPKPLAAVGYNPAIPIWRNVMNQIHKNKEYKEFEIPTGFTAVSICSLTGKRATELCSLDFRGSKVYTEYFEKNQIPSGSCDLHHEYTICTASNLLAGDNCPESMRKRISAFGISDNEEDLKNGFISSKICDHVDMPVDNPVASEEQTEEQIAP